jgi:hypothetical protein
MKKLILSTITIMMTLVSFAFTGNESLYESTNVTYSVEKIKGEVIIHIDFKDLAQYAEVSIVRSDNPTTYFRSIKQLSDDKLNELAADSKVVDKYPLPGGTNSYYKLVTIDHYGVQKSYPSVKLSK